MRRWMFMAALSATLLGAPLWGQRVGNGRMAMGGAPGGYVAHGGGFVGAPHGASWGGGFHGPHGPGFSGHPGHPSHPIHYPYYGWRYPWWGYRGYYGYPWWPGWYGGPGVIWSDASYSYPAETDPGYAYPPPNNSNANIAYEQQQEEIDRLNDEVARLRAESGPADRAQESPAAQTPAALLVFRDRHSEEIQNYAIAGNTLWVFRQERARKIPIAELDVAATAKANADRGIDFRLPGQ